MADQTNKVELMGSLRRLVRGLSALFWGLPLSLVICVQSSVTDLLRPLGVLPPMMATGLLLYGLFQLGSFQKQERIWLASLERAKLFALINVGLSPFVFWWQKFPQISFYGQVIGVLSISALLFLYNLNQVLQRLTAMLPDETLRSETRLFTSMNLSLVVCLMGLILAYSVLGRINDLPPFMIDALTFVMELRRQLLVILVLVPLAMTMTLLWKVKEVVLASVFNPQA